MNKPLQALLTHMEEKIRGRIDYYEKQFSPNNEGDELIKDWCLDELWNLDRDLTHWKHDNLPPDAKCPKCGGVGVIYERQWCSEKHLDLINSDDQEWAIAVEVWLCLKCGNYDEHSVYRSQFYQQYETKLQLDPMDRYKLHVYYKWMPRQTTLDTFAAFIPKPDITPVIKKDYERWNTKTEQALEHLQGYWDAQAQGLFPPMLTPTCPTCQTVLIKTPHEDNHPYCTKCSGFVCPDAVKWIYRLEDGFNEPQLQA